MKNNKFTINSQVNNELIKKLLFKTKYIGEESVQRNNKLALTFKKAGDICDEMKNDNIASYNIVRKKINHFHKNKITIKGFRVLDNEDAERQRQIMSLLNEIIIYKKCKNLYGNVTFIDDINKSNSDLMADGNVYIEVKTIFKETPKGDVPHSRNSIGLYGESEDIKRKIKNKLSSIIDKSMGKFNDLPEESEKVFYFIISISDGMRVYSMEEIGNIIDKEFIKEIENKKDIKLFLESDYNFYKFE